MSGKELVKLTGHTGEVTQATWSKDESKILTSSDDKTVRIWYAHMQDLISAACHRVPRNITKNAWDLYMEGPYRPTCSTVPLPDDVIEAIQAESKVLIQQGKVISATQRLQQLNDWLKTNGQFSTDGVNVSTFIAQVSATTTTETLSPTVTPTPRVTPTPS